MNTAIKQEIVYLPASSLIDSPFQPTNRTSEGIEELSASVRQLGILEPLIVRDTATGPKPAYEIVVGHRRRRAAINAEITDVPCIIRDLSDGDARLIIAVENTQRLELDALSEAEIIAPLNGPSLAQKLGRGERYTLKRLSLLLLSEDARTALVEGKITLGAAEHLATLADPEAAKEALKMLLLGIRGDSPFEPVTGRRAKIIVDQHRLPLADARWGLADTTLGALACSSCPKRSGAQSSLFDEGVDAADRCLDQACYRAKEKKYFEKMADENSENDDEEGSDRPRNEAPKPLKKTSPEPTKPAVGFERQARDAAVEKAIVLIAKAIAKPQRKLDDPKLLKMTVGLIVRARGFSPQVQDVLDRRGMPRTSEAALTAIGSMTDPHEVFSLLVECLVSDDADWTGEETCETSIAAAAKFCKVDLAKLKSDALIELQNESKPAQKAPEPKSAAAVKTEEPAFAVDDRVRVRKPSPHAGRVGKIESVFTMNGAERAFVVLDVNDKEKTPKAPSILMKDLELETPPSTVEKGEPKATFDPQSVECPTCKAAIGAPCTKKGGGYHATRTKAASDNRVKCLACDRAKHEHEIWNSVPTCTGCASIIEEIEGLLEDSKRSESALIGRIVENFAADEGYTAERVKPCVEYLIQSGKVHRLADGWVALQPSLLPPPISDGAKAKGKAKK